MDVIDELKYFAGELLGLNEKSREQALQYALERLLAMAEKVAVELREIRRENDGQDKD